MSKQNKKGAAAPTKTRKALKASTPRESKRAPATAAAPRQQVVAKTTRGKLGSSSATSGRVGVSSKPMNFHGGRTPFGDRRRFHDSVFVEVVKAPSTITSGTILWSRKNRCALPGSFLEVQAGLYNRWRIHKWTYTFVPVPGAEFANQLLLATDPDPLSVYDDITTNIQRLSILPGSMIEQLWKGLRCTYPVARDRADLWTKDLDPNVADYADRFSIAGNTFLVNVATGDMLANQEIGSIRLDFDIEMYDPKLSLSSLSSGLYTLLSDASGGNPFIDAAASESVGVFRTVMDVIIGLTTAGASPMIWEVLTEAVNTYFDFVPYEMVPPSPETRKQRHIRDVSKRKFAAHLGAAPSELPGFGPGHYFAELTFFTTNPMYDGSDFAIIHEGTQSAGGPTKTNDSTDIEFFVSNPLHPYRNPITGHEFLNKATLFIEFVITTSRGYYDLRLVQNLTAAGFVKTAGDECVLRFTRNEPNKWVNYPLASVATRGDIGPTKERPEVAAFRHFMKLYGSSRTPDAKKTTDVHAKRGISFAEVKAVIGPAGPPAPRVERESKIPPASSGFATRVDASGSRGSSVERSTLHDVATSDGEWHFVPTKKVQGWIDPDPPAPPAAAAAPSARS